MNRPYATLKGKVNLPTLGFVADADNRENSKFLLFIFDYTELLGLALISTILH